MEYECNVCNRRFDALNSLDQHKSMAHREVQKVKGKINFKKYFIFSAIILIVVLFSLTIFSYSKRSGEYDSFTKCLTEAGVVVYGNDFCSYTSRQLNFFGKSKKYLNYVKCIDNEGLCNSKGVEITPTWEINGESHSGVLNFEKLSALTGCEVNSLEEKNELL